MSARWTPKLAAARAKRSVDAAERNLQKAAYEWGDVNQYVVDRCDNAIAALDEVREAIDEALAHEEERD